jgi:hypothetical protein
LRHDSFIGELGLSVVICGRGGVLANAFRSNTDSIHGPRDRQFTLRRDGCRRDAWQGGETLPSAETPDRHCLRRAESVGRFAGTGAMPRARRLCRSFFLFESAVCRAFCVGGLDDSVVKVRVSLP